MNLVIVESPAKAKTINKYLGDNYKVLASYGHIRDLPSKNGSVDPDQDFKMEWEIDSFSKKYLKEITDTAKDSKKIILRQADISSSGDIINEEVAINYGFFIETFIDFMIVAFTIFIVIKFLNKLKIQAEDPSNNKVSTPRNIKLLTEINDSLKDLNKNLTKKN